MTAAVLFFQPYQSGARLCQNTYMTATVRALPSMVAAPEVQAVPETVRLLRQRRGMTLAQLSENVAKKPAWASRVETGTLPLRGRDLLDCAAALSVPPAIPPATPLPEAGLEGVHFRKYRVPQKVEARATAEANFVAYLVNTLLVKAGQDPAARIPKIDVAGSPTTHARLACSPPRPSGNDGALPLARSATSAGHVEADGLYIAPLPPTIPNVAAITASQGPELAPITLVTRSVVDDTRRFTVAHELAHLVMDEASGPSRRCRRRGTR